MINFNVNVKKVCEKDYVWNSATCNCENGKSLISILDNSAIMCDEIIDADMESNNKETKTFPTNFNEKKLACKTQNSYIFIYLHFH